MALPLLQTKLHAPALRPTLVSRPRLFAQLQARLTGKLTLVAAPAGFGKTTLIADWVQQTSMPTVWLALDAGDNDLMRFWRYVVGALQSAQPTLGQATATLLQLPQPAPIEEILTSLLNELAAMTQKLILVLDDYHLIEAPTIHQAMTFLVERLPPQLHLVLISRSNPPLPLARLRGQGELTEIRAADLRFRLEESVAFFQHFAQLVLPQPALARLVERTEGWVVGLQLAALSLEQQRDVAGFVQNFSGSNRFVLDYLLEEVLAQRSSAIQTFLLTTSVLDRMCGPLCDALLDEPFDRPTHTILQELEQANLFIIALDDERCWYRYHHLFADMLQQRLRQSAPESVADLQARASRWFERQGLLDEAVEYARRAGDLVRVSQLVEPEIRSLIMRGFFDMARRWLATLRPALIQARPRLLIAQAWLRFFEIPIGDFETPLRQAEQILGQEAEPPSTETSALLAEMAALRAVEAGVGGKPTAKPLMEEALRLAGPDDHFVQSIVNYSLALLDWGNEAWTTIEPIFQRAITAAQASVNVIMAAGVRYRWAMWQMEQGDLAGAEASLRASESFAHSQPNLWPWPIVDSVQVGRGRLCYERNDLAAARALLQEGIELAQRRNNIYVLIDGYLALAWVHQAQNNAGLAQATLDQASTLVGKTTRPSTPHLVASHQARLWLVQGQQERATQWAQAQMSLAPLDPSPTYLVRDLALAAIYCAQGVAMAPAALALLDRLDAIANELVGRRLQILTLRAIACHQLGQATVARQAIQAAVTLGESVGYVRLLVDQGAALVPLLVQLRATPYRNQLLAALGQAPPTPTTQPVPSHVAANQGLSEPLSARELEVLRLVVADASNQEIAEQLVITLGTVKNHMTNILGKLGVRNRWAAIRKTKELGLL